MKLNPAISLQEITEFIGGEFKGNPEQLIMGLNEIHMVEHGDLTFVDHPKYYERVLKSKATTIIINKKVDPPVGKAIIFSDDPFRDYVKLVKKFSAFESSNKIISDTAEIGEGTIIQPGAFIGNHVTIGKNCLIHSNVSIYDHSIIGNHVIIHSNSVIGADAFYFKRRPDYYDKLVSCGRAIIEDHVEIGALVTIDKGVSGDTIIGKGSKLDNHIQIGHDTRIGHNCLFASAVVIAGCTTVQDDVIIWGQVAIQKDLTIGKGAVILATSAVDKDLAGNKVYFGTPADQAYKKWKELALIKKLPEMYQKLNSL